MKIPNNKLSSVKSFFLSELKELDSNEVSNFFLMCCDAWLGMSKMEVRMNPEKELSESEILNFFYGIKDLKKNRPVQYVIGKSWFYGLEFKIQEGALIPRPETEELVDWILANEPSSKTFLDIGTGSGCIALSIAKNTEGNVSAYDVSEDALKIASENGRVLGLNTIFKQVDILDKENWPDERFDVIVSNPPYIPNADKQHMHENVLEYEPGLALFVPDNDPLLFYKAIADFSLQSLNPGGSLYFEIHEDFGIETLEMLTRKNFVNIELRKDMQGKNRMVRAQKQ